MWISAVFSIIPKKNIGTSQRVDIVFVDTFFSKSTFVTPVCEISFHVISRFWNGAFLFQTTTVKPIGGKNVQNCMTALYKSQDLKLTDV